MGAAGDKLVVVDFWATWCGPCGKMAPKFEEFAKEYSDAIFLKVDVDELDDLAAEHEVSSLPCFKFFMNGKELSKITGDDEHALDMEIQKHIPSTFAMDDDF